MSDTPLPIAPVAGAESTESAGNVHGAWARLSGLGLALIAVGPLLVIVTGVGLAAFAVTDLVRRTSAEVAAIAKIVEDRISPQIEKIETAFGPSRHRCTSSRITSMVR